MKKRSEIDEKYKWDIGCFKTQKEIDEAFETFEKLIDESKQYYGKLGEKETFFKYHVHCLQKFVTALIIVPQFLIS